MFEADHYLQNSVTLGEKAEMWEIKPINTQQANASCVIKRVQNKYEFTISNKIIDKNWNFSYYHKLFYYESLKKTTEEMSVICSWKE